MPEGRLFTHESSVPHRTFEFTPELGLVRSFKHPYLAELVPFAGTLGITYDTESETLWWMNFERENGTDITRRILLLEGDLDGEETGRRIEIIPPDTPLEDFVAGGLSYDPATDLFYFLGSSDVDDPFSTRALWAVDREGTLAEGYPLRPEPYPPPALIGSPDAHGGAEGGDDGVRVEYGAYPQGALGYDRIAVVDRWGNDEGTELETPVPDELFEHAGWGINGNPLRSRVDPNGVMYMTFANFETRGIVGVRPHPLPPSWLVVDSDAGPEAAWDGTLAPGENREIILTFRSGARDVGEYTSSLQAFEAESGVAVEVPLVLTVTQGTGTEDEARAPEAASLAVYPNPSDGSAVVALTNPEAAGVRVELFDVAGRGFLREGYHADLVLVDDTPEAVRREDVLSKVGWSPFQGMTFHSRIASTWVNGVQVWGGKALVGRPDGQRLVFAR